MKLKSNYQATIIACFTGYIVQAIVNNFAPLLFITFHNTYGVSMDKVALLVSFNFGIQLLIDLLSSVFVDKLGYRFCIVMAHLFSGIGLILLAFLPEIMADAYLGLLIAVFVYAIGGGLIEVLVSPIVEACPTDRKEGTMSLLHSFYCWGHVFVVVVSTLYFVIFGIDNWHILAAVWAVIPFVNLFVFTKVPINHLVEEGHGLKIRDLIRSGTFWLMMLLMLCSGACEQAVSQWASTFAEAGLGVSKTLGDLMGPCMFAILMGTSRAFYAAKSETMPLRKFMIGSTVLCIACYGVLALVPNAVIGLIACGLTGLSVGIMWPGTFSTSSKRIPLGGTTLFALLALAGDLGCNSGPTLVGLVSSAYSENLHIGILAAAVFPVLMLVGLLFMGRKRKEGTKA